MCNQTKIEQFPSHKVLDGVPKIGYNVRLCPFPGSLEACMAYLNDPCDYDSDVLINGLTDRAAREDIAKGVRTARAKEAKAVERLEKAVAILER